MTNRNIRLFTALGLASAVVSTPATAQQVASAAAVQAGVAAAVRGSVKLVSYKTPQAVGRDLASGDAVYLGDKIEAGPKAGLQVMLMDETIFTIGPDSAIVIDRFIYDPAKSAGKVSAKVLRGVFRFVSGKVAANKPSDMEVKLPNGTIGIRGTSAGGFVRNGVSEVVLLGPGTGNNVGEPGGRIIVSGTTGGSDVHITRVNYGTRLAGNAAPTPAVQWDASKMRSLAGALRAAAPNNAPGNAAPGASQGRPQQQQQTQQTGGQQQAATGRLTGVGNIGRQAGQDVGIAGLNAGLNEQVGTDGSGKRKPGAVKLSSLKQNEQISSIQQIKNTLSGITSVAQLNAIGGGIFSYPETTVQLGASSNYKFSYQINFNSKSHTGTVQINANTADGYSTNSSGNFSLLANPFTQPGGSLNLSEGPATVPAQPGGNQITVNYKFVNQGGLATRIDHQVTYAENGSSHTADGSSARQ